NRFYDMFGGPQRGDDERRAPAREDGEIILQSRIAVMNDEIDAIGRGVGMGGETLFYFREPGFKPFAAALVERGKGADEPGLAGLGHDIGIGDQKERRGDRRKSQSVL